MKIDMKIDMIDEVCGWVWMGQNLLLSIIIIFGGIN